MTILPNNVAVVDGDTHCAVWCAQQGLVHDQWMSALLTGVMRTHNVYRAVDVGANIGTLTKVMLNAGAHTWAFEPNPDAADCLAYNCAGAHIHRVALGETRGQCRMFKNANAAAARCGGVSEPTDDPVSDIVPVETLDSFHLQPGLIKIDAEGYEVRVLRGAKATIAKHRPVIIAEVNHGHLARFEYTPQDLFGFLGAYGYKWSILQPDARPGDEQYDILAVPK